MLQEIFKGMPNASEAINENFQNGSIVEHNLDEENPENGHYIKFGSGWMVCEVKRLGNKEYSISDATGALFRIAVDDWTFPEQFTDAPIVVESMERSAGTQCWVARGANIFPTHVTGAFGMSTHSSTKGYYSAIAFGRYK